MNEPNKSPGSHLQDDCPATLVNHAQTLGAVVQLVMRDNRDYELDRPVQDGLELIMALQAESLERAEQLLAGGEA